MSRCHGPCDQLPLTPCSPLSCQIDSVWGVLRDDQRGNADKGKIKDVLDKPKVNTFHVHKKCNLWV